MTYFESDSQEARSAVSKDEATALENALTFLSRGARQAEMKTQIAGSDFEMHIHGLRHSLHVPQFHTEYP
jgi:hypothetical protein